MSTITPDFFSIVSGKIREAIQTHVEKEFDSLKTKLVADLESRKNEICSGILIGLMKTVEIERSGQTINVRIKEIKE